MILLFEFLNDADSKRSYPAVFIGLLWIGILVYVGGFTWSIFYGFLMLF